MKFLALALLAGCQGPDRWHTSVARSDGASESDYGKLDFDTETTTLEVGVSGPIGVRSAAPERPKPMPEYIPATTIPATADGADLPWVELLLLLGGAAGWEGSKRGYQRVRRPKG